MAKIGISKEVSAWALIGLATALAAVMIVFQPQGQVLEILKAGFYMLLGAGVGLLTGTPKKISIYEGLKIKRLEAEEE